MCCVTGNESKTRRGCLMCSCYEELTVGPPWPPLQMFFKRYFYIVSLS